jgi:hypothetical protein
MLTEISIAVVIVFVCLLLHVVGILLMAEWLLQHRQYFEPSGASIHFSILMLVSHLRDHAFTRGRVQHVGHILLQPGNCSRTSRPLFIFRW